MYDVATRSSSISSDEALEGTRSRRLLQGRVVDAADTYSSGGGSESGGDSEARLHADVRRRYKRILKSKGTREERIDVSRHVRRYDHCFGSAVGGWVGWWVGRWLDRVPVDASLSIVWGASMHSSRVDVFCRGVPFANREWSPVWLELTGFIAHLIPSSPPPFSK